MVTEDEGLTDDLAEGETEELHEHHRLVADAGQKPLRVDKFLTNLVAHISRSKMQQSAKAGYVRVNGAPVKSNHKVKAFDVVTIELPRPVIQFELVPEPMDLAIPYEDEHVLVLIKPAGMVVHPGNGNYTGTLIHGVAWHVQQQQLELPPDLSTPKHRDTEIPRPGLVHRLDKDTTGVMVLGKTEMAMTELSNQFFDRTVERRYHALVWGDLADDGTITGHIGRSLRDRKLQSVFSDGSSGKHAVTHYKVLERLGPVTFVECKLETGRTHQIRVHMQHIGHPLFGDVQYGGNRAVKGLQGGKYAQFLHNCFERLPRQALHAKTLGFTHPGTGEWLSFDSELPEDMEWVLQKWRNYLQPAGGY